MVKTYYIEKTSENQPYTSVAFERYFEGTKQCVLDIETTGLSPDHSRFVLGGLLSFTQEGAQVQQFFAEDFDQEKETLAAYLAALANYDTILTYNGKHFDLPFLQKRADRLDLDMPPLPYNLDLYLVLNGFSSLRKFLPNLKQKTVEDFMGLWPYRKDTISGGESATLYLEYLYKRENREDITGYVDAILLHNRDDLLQLARLLPVLEKTDLHRAMFSLGFPAGLSDHFRLIVEKTALEKNGLRITGRQVSRPQEYLTFDFWDCGIHLIFEKSRLSFDIWIPIFRKQGLAFLDLSSFPEGLHKKVRTQAAVESGYLVLQNKNDINYNDINHFIKVFLEKALEESFGGR